MAAVELHDIDLEEVELVLIKVEDSFNLRFDTDELAHINTFGQLCVHMQQRLQLNNTGGCTSQQAFYKLRSALVEVFNVDSASITPTTLWQDLLPLKDRISNIKRLKKQLGFKLYLLQPQQRLTTLISLSILASFAVMFFNWVWGLTGLITFILAFIIVHKTGRQFTVKTVGQMATKMTMESYANSRRKIGTFNKAEIEQVLTSLFVSEFGLHHGKVSASSTFKRKAETA